MFTRTPAPSLPAYSISIPVFEGPLDLLLHLIERVELDITTVAIAQVTDQFLKYIGKIHEHSPDEISSFLIMAARLLEIKSRALLPRSVEIEAGEEDPGEALVRQLILYKRFKQIAEHLRTREANGLRTYLRLSPPPKIEGTIDLEGLDLAQLMHIARDVLTREAGKPEIKTVVASQKISIREIIGNIVQTLQVKGRESFMKLLGRTRTRLEVVVTFLAMLELIKQRRVTAHQATLFSDIELVPSEEWSEDSDFELEFDE